MGVYMPTVPRVSTVVKQYLELGKVPSLYSPGVCIIVAYAANYRRSSVPDSVAQHWNLF